MRISEIFYSIQGEGKLMGVPSVFVRASGCNLRCTWCDTPYASWQPEGPDQSVEQILQHVQKIGAKHVVITGGEPMIMPDLPDLCGALKDRGHHITVETAATVFADLPLNLASLSPKLSNSTPHEREGGRFAKTHEAHRLNISVIQRLIEASPDFQLKFVVSEAKDLDEIKDLLGKLKRWNPADVLLMPEGTDIATLDARAPWITEICKHEGYRYCPRLHVQLYGNKRGT